MSANRVRSGQPQPVPAVAAGQAPQDPVQTEFFARFSKKFPLVVMFLAAVEYLFPPAVLNALFERVAQKQYTRELTFSTLVRLMLWVALRAAPAVRGGAKLQQELTPHALAVSLSAVYAKLQGVERAVCEALVAAVAQRAQLVLARLAPRGEAPVSGRAGRQLHIVDGNFVAGTEHRLKPLRGVKGSAQPGMGIWIYDDATGLFVECLLAEDGHTNERKLFERLIERLQPGVLYLADRNYCTIQLIEALQAKGCQFLIRQHGATPVEELTPLKYAGRCPTGSVYSQQVRLAAQSHGHTAECRRIVVVLDKPTQDGATEVALLTNLDSAEPGGRAKDLAQLYLTRWHIEEGFRQITQVLRGEVTTLGYPSAALFSQALAVCAYNLLMVVRAALAAAHGAEWREQTSNYEVAQHVLHFYGGLIAMVPPGSAEWQALHGQPPRTFAAWLTARARTIDPERFRKAKRGPKKPPPVRRKTKAGRVATAREIANYRAPQSP